MSQQAVTAWATGWINYLLSLISGDETREEAADKRLATIEEVQKGQGKMLQQIQDAQNAAKAFQTEVTADFAALDDKVATLTTQVAALRSQATISPDDLSGLETLTKSLQDATAAAHAKYQPAPVAPVEPAPAA